MASIYVRALFPVDHGENTMTLCELLTYLHRDSGYPVWDGSCEETIEKALAQTHNNPPIAQALAAIAGSLQNPSGNSPISRAEATNALGPLRLRAMGDQAPPEDLRRINGLVHAIDSAFNEEALAARPS